MAITYPDIQFELRTLPGAEQLEALRTGAIDVAFVHLPVGGDEFVVERILRHPYVLAVPAGHVLAKRSSVPLSALVNQHYIFFERRTDPNLYDSIFEFCRSAGVVLNIVYETSQIKYTLGLIASGMACAVSHF